MLKINSTALYSLNFTFEFINYSDFIHYIKQILVLKILNHNNILKKKDIKFKISNKFNPLKLQITLRVLELNQLQNILFYDPKWKDYDPQLVIQETQEYLEENHDE
ncbi:unnamed protein product [Paramecium sonneborni]|uniref:Uncharacterized protein n=1 Tax=Paramecium sonneborni TaxID=65129 RepID=A0A8S1KH71_9CILI|nr:unnamed protein product [Paramecium sonneborni]